jgi:hypothetical protein
MCWALLQQFTAANGQLGLELYTLPRDENIPTGVNGKNVNS